MFFWVFIYSAFPAVPLSQVPLNKTIGILLVSPDGRNSYNSTFFSILLSLVNEILPISMTSYSKYNLADKESLSPQLPNYVITRDDQFLEVYKGNNTIIDLASEINDAFLSWVEYLIDSNIEEFKNSSNQLFLLSNNETLSEFEDIAFYYRKTKVRFGFIKSDNFSLRFFDNKNNGTLEYDNRISMIHFIRNCKKLKTQTNEHSQKSKLFSPHTFQFVAITDNLTDQAQASVNEVNNHFGHIVDSEISTWENSTDIMKMCSLTQIPISFVFFKKNSRYVNKCEVFQDMDVYSHELLRFFVYKSISEVTSIKMDMKKASPNLNLYAPVLSPANLPSYVPDRRVPVLVFIENKQSFSAPEAKIAFNSVSKDFPNEKIKFYRMKYTYYQVYLPSADNFPTFVIYEPNNRVPHIFNSILTIDSLRAWIQFFVDKDYSSLDNDEQSHDGNLGSDSNDNPQLSGLSFDLLQKIQQLAKVFSANDENSDISNLKVISHDSKGETILFSGDKSDKDVNLNSNQNHENKEAISEDNEIEISIEKETNKQQTESEPQVSQPNENESKENKDIHVEKKSNQPLNLVINSEFNFPLDDLNDASIQDFGKNILDKVLGDLKKDEITDVKAIVLNEGSELIDKLNNYNPSTEISLDNLEFLKGIGAQIIDLTVVSGNTNEMKNIEGKKPKIEKRETEDSEKMHDEKTETNKATTDNFDNKNIDTNKDESDDYVVDKSSIETNDENKTEFESEKEQIMTKNDEPANDESTNDESINDEPTNDESINDEPTNDESINDELTNDEPTNDEPTNDESINDESTNDEPTNDESTNDESTNDEPTNDESTNDESTNDEPANDESTNDEPANDESTNDESTNDEPANDESTNDEPANDESTNDEPTNDESTNDEPANDESTNDESTNDEPTNDEPTNDEPTNDEPANDESTNDESTNDEPANDESTNDEPTNDESTNDEPTNDESTNDEPTNDESTNDESINDEPTNDEIMNDEESNNLPEDGLHQSDSNEEAPTENLSKSDSNEPGKNAEVLPNKHKPPKQNTDYVFYESSYRQKVSFDMDEVSEEEINNDEAH